MLVFLLSVVYFTVMIILADMKAKRSNALCYICIIEWLGTQSFTPLKEVIWQNINGVLSSKEFSKRINSVSVLTEIGYPRSKWLALNNWYNKRKKVWLDTA